MDLNQILLWTVGISCLVLLMRSKQLLITSQSGWIVICLTILISIAIGVKLFPQEAGYLAGLLWFSLIFLPLIANQRIQKLVSLEQYAIAARQAAFWRWFHPVDGWWERPQIFEALDIAQKGNLDRAIHILNGYGDRYRNMTLLAKVLVYKVNLQWEELLHWMRQDAPEKLLADAPNLSIYYIRALAETGNINEAIAEFKRLSKILDDRSYSVIVLTLLAFAGETNTVARLFRNSSQKGHKYFESFWLGTAHLAAGNQVLGRQLITESARLVAEQRAKTNPDSDYAHIWLSWERNIKRRSERGCPPADRVLTPESRWIIEELQTRISHEFKYSGALTFDNKKVAATYGLIAINCAMFVWETVAGGNENEETLYRLGALVPTVVWEGEWWRLLSATFLHYGIAHLVMNMLGLYFLGAYVESNLGIGRYLTAYFFSGIGSMLAVTLVAIFTNAPSEQLLVGASGAIMGMVGALAAILLKGWKIDKAPLAGQRLRSVMFIIGLQIVFDLNTPQVSFLGHISGLILGFAIACLFVFATPKARI